MGYTGAIVLAKSQADPDVLDELLTDLGFDGATPGPDGWLRAESEYAVESVDPAFAELIAERLDGPTLCGAVVQSDFAYVFVAEPGMAATSLVLSPAAVRATGAGLSEAEMRASAESFAIWSSHTPRSMSTDEVAKTTSRREVFAEDRLWDLIERLGLEMAATQSGVAGPPSFAVGLDGYLRAMDWMTDGFWCVDRGVSWADYRYVPGVGDGFIGIWDREAPDRPTRFADTREGRGKLIDRWEELRHPFELELAGATDFRGIVGLLPVESDLRPAGRLLPITQCRYVPGWGKGFAGVWDRTMGGEPVVRFKGRARARDEAVAWATLALEKMMAAEKAVGPDRWVAMEVPSQWDRKRSLRFYMVVFEAADPDWSAPPFERPAVDGYIVYQVTKKDDGGFWMAALWSVATDDAEIARREAHKWGSLGAWKRVPDVVGLTLLETATWCMESGSAGPTGALRRLLGRG